MQSEPFVIERTYDAPIAKVWDAISNHSQMKQWYFDIAEFKAEPGFEFVFYGGDDGQSFKHICVVREVVPQKKLSYSWRYDGYEGDSLVTFELFEDGEKTRLKLTHEGLETFPPIKSFKKENFAAGWTEITGKMLKDFVEKE